MDSLCKCVRDMIKHTVKGYIYIYIFWKNTHFLKAVNYFSKKATPWIFVIVLNMLEALIGDCRVIFILKVHTLTDIDITGKVW